MRPLICQQHQFAVIKTFFFKLLIHAGTGTLRLFPRSKSLSPFSCWRIFWSRFCTSMKAKAEGAWSSASAPEADATEQLALRTEPGKCMVCRQSAGDGSSLLHLPYNWYIWKREMCSLRLQPPSQTSAGALGLKRESLFLSSACWQ